MKKSILNIRVDKELKDELKRAKWREDRSMGDIVRNAVKEWLRKKSE